MPSSLQARRIRSAISPRLAIRILENMTLAAPYSTTMSGSPNSTGCASSTRICFTVPDFVEGMLFIVFIASMIRIVWPSRHLVANLNERMLRPVREKDTPCPTIGEVTEEPAWAGFSSTVFNGLRNWFGRPREPLATAGDATLTGALIDIWRATRIRVSPCSSSISERFVSSSRTARSRIRAVSNFLLSMSFFPHLLSLLYIIIYHRQQNKYYP